MVRGGYDSTCGTIVGGDAECFTAYYTFHREHDGSTLGSGNFKNDVEAEAYAKYRWPKEYMNGIEMRCYNG